MGFIKRFRARRLRRKLGRMVEHRQNNAVSDQVIAKEVALYYRLVRFYSSLVGCKKEPFAYELKLECYRMAASIGDVKACYLLGQELLERGKFWQGICESPFKFEINEKYRADAFQEAFQFLEEADKQDYALAKRLIGLAYINGWGKEVNQDHGFKLVVKSIDMLGEWPKVTEIFKKLQLNKPEFYAQLTNIQKGDG